MAAIKSRTTAGWLAIILGGLGAHQFYMNHTPSGVIRLCISIFGSIIGVGLGVLIMEILGIVEGIKYLKMSDEDFRKIYVDGGKAWL